MRTDKYMMAKAWMKQDQAPQSEALDTWNTLEAEFNEERKAMLMASAETDAIKEAMNKKFGPGTVKYGSELPPIQNPFEDFEERNPAAYGGRMEFNNGLDVLPFKKLKNGKYSLRLYLGTENGKRIEKTFTGTKKQLRKIYKDRNVRVEGTGASQAFAEADSKGIPYEIKQGENKGKFAIRGPKEKNFSFYDTEELAQEHIDNYRAETDSVGGDRTGELENKKYKKGYKTKKQFLDFLAKNNIAGKNASSFAMNFNIKTEINPYNNNAYIYDTSQFTPEKIEEIQKAQVSSGTATEYAKNKFPPKPRSELIKIREDAIEAQGGIKKNSPFAGKKKLKVDLGHTGDYKTELITGDKLAYTPSDVNFEIGKKGGIDDKIRAVKKRQEQALATLEGDELKKVLNETDATLTRLADQTKGFKSVVLSNGKKYGGERLTIDPFDIYPGKTEVEIKAIQKEYLGKDGKGKKIITEGPNKTSAAEIQKIQDAVIFEENRKSNLKAASKIGKKEINNLIKVIGCPNFKAAGGRIEFSEGKGCFDKGTKLINSGMKGASKAALKNLAKLGPMLLKAGSAAMSGLIVPEALIVGLETAGRVGLGDTPSEAILRATDYLTPDSFFGDFLQKADLMKIERTLGKDVKNIAAQSFDRTNQSDKINKLEEKLKNLEAMTESGDFGYVGDLTNQINMTKDQIKQEKNKLKNTIQIGQESRDLYTERALENSYDASMAKSKFAASQLADSQSENPRLSAAQAMQDMQSQEQKNKNKIESPQMKPNLSAFVNFDDREMELLAARTGQDLTKLKQIQEYMNDERKISFADQARIFGKEQTYGTQGNMGQPVERTGPGYMTNYKPLNRFGSQQRPVLYPNNRGTLAEGGITGLRSKYEYKK